MGSPHAGQGTGTGSHFADMSRNHGRGWWLDLAPTSKAWDRMLTPVKIYLARTETRKKEGTVTAFLLC